MDLGHGRVDRPRVHPLLPVRVVAVVDPQRDRAAERTTVAHPGGHLGAVGLDLHAAAAAMAELAPREVAVDVLGPQLETGGEALHDRGQARAVRLPRCCEAERHTALTLLAVCGFSGRRGRRERGGYCSRATPGPATNIEGTT